ncbi:MAG: lysoplasmalogenase [Myxococcota bacterium]|nr:lysoplasmalogenase [Myxococcota bacterium]
MGALSLSVWGVITLCLCSLSLSLWGDVRERSYIRGVGKTAASLSFLLLFALSPDVGSAPAGFSPLLGVALSLSALGDVALLGEGEAALLCGLSAFFLAHIAFLLAFSLGAYHFQVTLGVLVVSLGIGAWIYRWLCEGIEERLRRPVIAYIIVISLMVSVAAGRAVDWEEGRWLLLGGAFAFWASDISVARDRFMSAGFLNRLWGLPLYYLAQIMLTFTLWR